MDPDRWLVVSVRAPSDEYLDDLAEGLVALGGAAVEERGRVLVAYLLPPPDPAAFRADAERRLRSLAGGDVVIEWRWSANEDWAAAWRKGLRPRRVGRRLVVTPSWCEVEAGAADVVLVIDPAMAFGTGEHATTRGALEQLEQAVRPGDRVLDVGTGSGILAIAAARLGAAHVLAVDNDADAVDNARENVARNGVTGSVHLAHATVDAPFLAAQAGGLDVIVANVLSGVLEPLLHASHVALGAHGRLILGGILESEARAMIEACVRAGFALRHEHREEEWWGGLFLRGADQPASPEAGAVGPEDAGPGPLGEVTPERSA